MGKPTVVVVDDYLPFDSYGRTLYDHESADKAIWGPLMEKVWAKVNGNYDNIVGGNSQEAFGLLLGAPSIYYSNTGSAIGYNAADSTTI